MGTKHIVPRAEGQGGIGTATLGWGELFITNTTDDSSTQGGKLTLTSNDGAAMQDGSRLGVIEFKGAESSSTLTIGARIEAICDAAWTATENGTSLKFFTTDADASESLVLTLDSNKLATFTGSVAISADISAVNATLTGYLRGPASFVIDPATHGNDTGTVVIAGNLQVDGTTTTVNSTVVTIDDPVFSLGGDTAPGSDDDKDRGIQFRYYTSSAAKIGFFGYDDSANAFTFIPDATNSSEVFSGSVGNVIFNDVTAASLDISGDADIDGTLEADAITVDGTTLSEFISDTTGAMFSSNTETGVTVTYQDADNTIDVEINPAQTTITSLLATDIKIGEDDQTKIDFETADEIHFYAANVEQVYLGDNIFGPQSDSDVDLGSSSARWKDAHVDNINVQGTVTTLGLNIAGTTVTSNAGELNVLDGITAVVGELNTLDLGATAFGIALGSKAVILDSNKDYSGIRNFTTTGDVKIGSSTTVTPATQADDIVIDKGASESGITLVSTAAASLRFGDAASASVGYIEYNHSSNAFSFGTNGGTRLTIASGGDAAFSGNIEIPNDGTIGSEGTADGIKINSSGKIGINSSSTSLVYPLEVHGGNGDAIIFKDTTNSVTTWLGAFGGAAVAGALTSGDDFALYAGNAEKVRISSGGDVTFANDIILPQDGVVAFSSVSDEYITASADNLFFGTGNLSRFKISGDTISIPRDGAILNFGVDGEVNLQHVHNNGILFGSGASYALYFRDTDLYVHSPSDGTLKLNANTEIDLTAPTIDINGAADISGLLTMSGGANPDLNVQGTAIIRGNSSSHETHYFTTAAANVAAYHMKDASGNIKNTFSAGGLNFITGGNFVAGATTDVTGTHYFQKAVSANGGILYVGSDTTGRFSLVVQASDSGYNNTPDTCLKVGGTSSTSRSISAAGTFNGSGADYAEYMTKSVTDVINKGDIVGVDSNGLLTNIFNDAISFVIKSTNPSFIGNDTWGIESEDKDEIEEARNKVDRIAFSGQVPCNITGASVGDYIIPVASSDGKITGEAVSNPTFEQYKISVGKVWKIMENGNSWVAVKIG